MATQKKRKESPTNIIELERLTTNQDYAIEFFLEVWSTLEGVCDARQQFAISWLMRDDYGLDLIAGEVLGIEKGKFSRRLLYNGYICCRKLNIPIFPSSTWQQIDNAFAREQRFKKFPKELRRIMSNLRCRDRWEVFNERMSVCALKTFPFSSELLPVRRVSKETLVHCKGSFIGEWDRCHDSELKRNGSKLFIAHPSDLFSIKKVKNITLLYDESCMKRSIVGMVMTQKDLNVDSMALIRTTLEQLFNLHPKITRGIGKRAYKGKMTGFGPLNHTFKQNKVSFFTQRHKLAKSLINFDCDLQVQFQHVVDRYSHSDAIDIILGLFLLWCPMFVESLFKYSAPYLDMSEYDSEPMESLLGGRTPNAYQLYITKDYSSRMHKDYDKSDFTLCYCSHPDASVDTPVDFLIPEFGVSLPIGDGDLYAFKSNYVHGTACRTTSLRPACQGCVAVNSSLSRLISSKRHCTM